MVLRGADAELRLAQEEADVTAVPSLDSPTPIELVTTGRRELRCSSANGTLPAPVAVERQVERISLRRLWWIVVHTPEHGAIVAHSARMKRADVGWHAALI